MATAMNEQMFEAKQIQMKNELPRLYKKYKKQYEQLMENSPLAKYGGINENYAYQFGKTLEQFDFIMSMQGVNMTPINENYQKPEHLQKNEAYVGTTNDAGQLPRIGYQFLTAYYGMNPLAYIASIQNIDMPNGLVLYKDVVAETTRGSVTAGQKLRSSDQAPDVVADQFASGQILNEVIATGDGITTSFTFDLVKSPVLTRTIEISYAGMLAGSVIKDNGDGFIYSYGGLGVEGTVTSYDNGTGTLVFNTAPANALQIVCTYRTNFEANGQVPLIQPIIRSKQVEAIQFMLGTKTGFLQKYLLKKVFDRDAEAEAITDLNGELIEQVTTRMVRLYEQKATALSSNTNFNDDPASYTGDTYLHRLNVDFTIGVASEKIYAQLGRGEVEFMICGIQATPYISKLPSFEPIKVKTGGTSLIGMYEGKPVLKSRAVTTNKIICGHKSDDDFDAPGTQGIFMPLTNYTPQDSEASTQIKAIGAQWCSVDVNLEKALTIITIQNPQVT